MLCKKCGAEINDGFEFCIQCGAKACREDEADSPKEYQDTVIKVETEACGHDNAKNVNNTQNCIKEDAEEDAASSFHKEEKNNRKKYIRMAALAVAALLIAGAAGFFWANTHPKQTYDELIELGYKYLLEENYEEAVIAFEKAIKKDDKAPEPELGLAETYVAMNNGQEAFLALQRADGKLGGMEDSFEKDRLTELMRDIAIKVIIIYPDGTDFLKEIAGSSVSIGQVITDGFPQVQLVVNYNGLAEKPNRASFIIRENGTRRQISDITDVNENSAILSYDTDVTEAGEERKIDLVYKKEELEITDTDSYSTPESKDVNLILEQVDATNYPTVRLYYRVEDSESGNIVDGLTEEDFKLYEIQGGNSISKEIKNFMQLEGSAGLNVEVVADVSGSMSGSSLQSSKEAIINFAKSLQYGAGDKIEIMTFDDSIYKICSFTTDTDIVETCVNGIQAGGSTAFYDALIAASNEVMMQSGARCLIAFTDGADNASISTPQEVVQYATKYSLPIFIIGVGSDWNQQELEQIAGETGGFYRNIEEINDLQAIYEKIYEGRKKLYVVEYDTAADIEQIEEREITFEVNAPGICTGEVTNTYVPQNAIMGESQIAIVDLQSELEQMKAQQAEPSNVEIDYNEVKKFSTLEEYLEYLENKLIELGGNNTNDQAKKNISEFITYAITQTTKGKIDSSDNNITLSAENLVGVFDETLAAKEKFEELLRKYNVALNKKIDIRGRADAEKIDLNKPIIITLKEDLPGVMGSQDELLLLLGRSNRTLTLNTENLIGLLNDGDVVVQLIYEDGSVKVTFADSKGKTQERISGNISLGVPAENAMSTIYANYSGGSDNWGGQYDSANKKIEFETKYSGEYDILEKEILISDIGGLPQLRQQAVRFMVSKGYFALEEENFSPEKELIRFEFTEALVKMFFALDRSLTCDFPDVDKDSPYYSYVASAQADNIVEGYENGTFQGDKTITKQEVIAICARTLAEMRGYSYPTDPDKYLKFEDADQVSKWAEADVALAVREGLIKGDTALEPKAFISRGESAELLYNLFMLLYETDPVEMVAEGVAVDINTSESAVKSGFTGMSGMKLYAAAGAVGLLLCGAVAAALMSHRKRKKQKSSDAEQTDTSGAYDTEQTDMTGDYDTEQTETAGDYDTERAEDAENTQEKNPSEK